MKKIFLAALSVVMIGGLLTTTSCKKGDQGPKGDSAMANVYYSSWKTLLRNTWALSTDSSYIYNALEDARLDSSVLDKGVVHVYLNLGTSASPEIYALPFRSGDSYIDFALFKGAIGLYTNTLLGVSEYLGAGQGLYRYVIIPGGVKTGARTTGESPVDFKDYNAVKAYYNIKD